MRVVSLDLETTSTDPEWGQIIEMGAVIDDLNDPKPFEQIPKFHCYVVHEKYTGSSVALSMNSTILKKIAEKQVGYYYFTIDEIVSVFNEWLKENYPGYPEEKVNFAGKNFALFDLQFLKKLEGWDDEIKYRYRILEPAMLFLKKNDKHLPDSQECLNRSGIGGEVSHTALQDAMDVIKQLRIAWTKL